MTAKNEYEGPIELNYSDAINTNPEMLDALAGSFRAVVWIAGKTGHRGVKPRAYSKLTSRYRRAISDARLKMHLWAAAKRSLKNVFVRVGSLEIHYLNLSAASDQFPERYIAHAGRQIASLTLSFVLQPEMGRLRLGGLG